MLVAICLRLAWSHTSPVYDPGPPWERSALRDGVERLYNNLTGQVVRVNSRYSQVLNNLRNVAIACQNHAGQHDGYLPTHFAPPDGSVVPLSWRVKILTYMLLGICVGVATLFYVPRLGSASPTTGLLWELEAIAAVIVGGAALKGGHGSIVGTIIGAILLSVISNILNLTSLISVYLNAAVQGFVIIIVAFMQKGRR